MKWLCLLTVLLTGCYKNHLYVQQESLDINFLASSKIGTPDPTRENPPRGQRLLIRWNFPTDLFERELTLHVMVRFWDNSEEEQQVAVETKRSNTALAFPLKAARGHILTYRVVAKDGEGQIVSSWNHPLWTELIQIGS